MTSLEGWGSAIELRPHARWTIPSGEHGQRTRRRGSVPNHHDWRPPIRRGYLRGVRHRAKHHRGTPGRGAVGYGTVQRDVAQLG